ncbi:MAG TPA: alkaline phosphatase family protein [Fimbriimonadaceae bacterium]|nr:alkaline phosphatase family protein [Fimbriimonadaceae bacterium]
MPKKKLVLTVIDSLGARYVLPALKSGRLPNMRALAHTGQAQVATTIFPSITHACLSSIATGAYPRDHGVYGAYFVEERSNDIAYFGSNIKVILSQGIDKFLVNFLYKLNHEHLKLPTLFEKIESAGLTAGVLNHLIYRGNVARAIKTPGLIGAMPGAAQLDEVCGPTIFYMGDFVGDVPDRTILDDAPSGPFKRYGVSDEGTQHVLLGLARRGLLPDFTLAYFPDNDILCHDEGPDCTFDVLEPIDRMLGSVIDALGGLGPALEETAFVIVGDHAQCAVCDESKRPAIELDEVLRGFDLIGAGEPLDEDRELLVAPNLRACAIYCNRPDLERVDRIAQLLISDPRVDQVMFRSDLVLTSEPGFRVLTSDRGTLRFWRGESSPNCAVDDYGTAWSWAGDLRTLDVSATAGRLVWGAYPNAFERIAGCLEAESTGHIWATARPLYEFRLPRINIHTGGGSHGSLHELDSLVPLITAGLPEGVHPPDHPRIVDISPLVLASLGLPVAEHALASGK